MPITVTTPIGTTPVIGLGANLRFSSDFIGPLPDGTGWSITITPTGHETDDIFSFANPTNGAHQLDTALLEPAWVTSQNLLTLPVDTPITVSAKILDSTGANTIDSGGLASTWSPDVAVAPLVESIPGTGGLTSEQAQQLTRVDNSASLKHLVDALTLIPLTNGPESGPINAFLPSPIFGVIVRMATIPGPFEPSTPDGDYWVKTIAVVRVFRGADLWLRVPIHTSSKIINLHSEALLMGLAEVVVGAWILDLSIQVNFLEGATGEVFLMQLP